MLKGIDVSGWQHDDADKPTIDWQQVKEAGVQWVMVKATQGIDFVSDWLETDVNGAHAARLVVGTYHFCEPGAGDREDHLKDAQMQAAHAITAVAGLPLSLGIACDLEEQGPFDFYRLAEWYKTFAAEVNKAHHHCPLNVDEWYLSELNGAPWGHRLWLSLNNDTGELPAGVKPWATQLLTPQDVPGIVGPVDCDNLLRPRSLNPSPRQQPKPAEKAPAHIEAALAGDRGEGVPSA